MPGGSGGHTSVEARKKKRSWGATAMLGVLYFFKKGHYFGWGRKGKALASDLFGGRLKTSKTSSPKNPNVPGGGGGAENKPAEAFRGCVGRPQGIWPSSNLSLRGGNWEKIITVKLKKESSESTQGGP